MIKVILSVPTGYAGELARLLLQKDSHRVSGMVQLIGPLRVPLPEYV